MPKVKVYNLKKKGVGEIDLSDLGFEVGLGDSELLAEQGPDSHRGECLPVGAAFDLVNLSFDAA